MHLPPVPSETSLRLPHQQGSRLVCVPLTCVTLTSAQRKGSRSRIRASRVLHRDKLPDLPKGLLEELQRGLLQDLHSVRHQRRNQEDRLTQGFPTDPEGDREVTPSMETGQGYSVTPVGHFSILTRNVTSLIDLLSHRCRPV